MSERCWAYDKIGRRCEQTAGHEGDHHVYLRWTDSECWEPNPAPVHVAEEPVRYVEPDDKPKIAPVSKCAACQHQHKAGPCKCGCYTHIG